MAYGLRRLHPFNRPCSLTIHDSFFPVGERNRSITFHTSTQNIAYGASHSRRYKLNCPDFQVAGKGSNNKRGHYIDRCQDVFSIRTIPGGDHDITMHDTIDKFAGAKACIDT